MAIGRRRASAALITLLGTASFRALGQTTGAAGPSNSDKDKKDSPPKESFDANSHSTIAVVGDSLADGIWGGIYRKLFRDKRYTVFRGAKNSVGFGGGDLIDALDHAFEGNSVDAVVMMIGANDRRAIYADGKTLAAYRSAEWPGAYRRRVDHFMDVATARSVPLVWVLLPVMREDDADTDARQINSIVVDAASPRPLVSTVPTRPMTFDADGKYAAYLKDTKGQQRLVRDTDGVHFTDYGYDMIADSVLVKVNAVSDKIGNMTSAAK
jgi:uncharacterized protein